MITQQSHQLGDSCQYAVKHYSAAWEMGTGLRIALPPGEYHVTSCELLENVHYLLLNERYRVIANESI